MDRDNSRLLEIINKFPEHRVAVVGDIMLDEYKYATPRDNPEADCPCVKLHRKERDVRLGGAGNAAHNMRSLGAKVNLYGIIGNDEHKSTVEALCYNANISLSALYTGQTHYKLRIIGWRFKQGMIRLDDGDDESNLGSVPEADQFFYDSLASKERNYYGGVLFCDYDKRVFRGELAQKVIRWAKEQRILSMVDPKVKNASDAERHRGVDVVKPNLEEARLLVGDTKKQFSSEQLVSRLREHMASRYAVITLGEGGAITYDGGFHEVTTRAREVSDVSGAGDTTAAALMLSLLSGASIVEAMNIANYAAGIKVEHRGTIGVTQEELIKRIKHEEIK